MKRSRKGSGAIVTGPSSGAGSGFARLLASAGILLSACGQGAPRTPVPGSAAGGAASPVAAVGDAASVAVTAVRPDDAPVIDLLHGVPTELRVSSTFEDRGDLIAKLVDDDLETAWNSRTGDLVGAWIQVRLPDGASVAELALTVGVTRADRPSYFAANHRVAKVRILREGKELGSFDLDPESRALQTLPVTGGGGTWRIEVAGVRPGSRASWREVCISELRIMGRAADGRAGAYTPRFGVGAAAAAGAPPPPRLVSTLREQPPALPLRLEGGASIVFGRPLGSGVDVAHEPVRLSAADRRAVAQVISDHVGRRFVDVQDVSRDELLGEIPGASLLPGAHLFRLVPGTRLLALSLSGRFEGVDGGKDAPAIVSILAVEKAPGTYAVVRLICSRLGCHCSDSALRVTPDRSALAWIRECPDSSDPATWERCVVHADAGRLVERCELLERNSEQGGDEMWRSCTAGDGDFYEAE